mmetsp:Transcript_11391/g.21753  ORF Transcript_11391/g.21753 Transcript_11391/m.21753 type:complete len:175 (+) Transcript_11391:80-604(+)
MAVPRINSLPSLTRRMTNKKLLFLSGGLVGAIVLVMVVYRMGSAAGFKRGQQEARFAADEYWISDSYERFVVPIDFAEIGDGWFFPKPVAGTCDSVHLCQVGAGGFFCRCGDQLCAFDRDTVHSEDIQKGRKLLASGTQEVVTASEKAHSKVRMHIEVKVLVYPETHDSRPFSI